MSEYQYYEFLAIDRPLSSEDTTWLRSLSTRANITATSFINTYHWGDFRGDPFQLMKRCFDAFVYVSNFGSCRFMLKVPKESIDLALVNAYCGECGVSVTEASENVLINFSIEGEPGDWEMDEDGTGLMAPLSMLRSELLDGDYRCLYLAWLVNIQQKTLEDNEREPPVPPGLKNLSGACETLCDFLQVDPMLLALAAEASVDRPIADQRPVAVRAWVESLSHQEQQELLIRFLAEGEASLRHCLLRRMRRELASDSVQVSSDAQLAPRTVGELIEAWETRVEAERQRIAAEHARELARKEAEKKRLRDEHLAGLAKRESAAWQQVESLIKTKTPKNYDEAVKLLRDLQEVATLGGTTAAFTARFLRLCESHASKPSLLKRLDRVNLH